LRFPAGWVESLRHFARPCKRTWFALSEKELDHWNPTFIADASQSVGAIMGKAGEGSKPTLYCYRYTLTFNEEKVLKSRKRDECVPGTRETLTAK